MYGAAEINSSFSYGLLSTHTFSSFSTSGHFNNYMYLYVCVCQLFFYLLYKALKAFICDNYRYIRIGNSMICSDI